MRISDGSSDVCSSDLVNFIDTGTANRPANCAAAGVPPAFANPVTRAATLEILSGGNPDLEAEKSRSWTFGVILQPRFIRSEEHTSELQSLMRISYAVFCLKKKKHINTQQNNN